MFLVELAPWKGWITLQSVSIIYYHLPVLHLQLVSELVFVVFKVFVRWFTFIADNCKLSFYSVSFVWCDLFDIKLWQEFLPWSDIQSWRAGEVQQKQCKKQGNFSGGAPKDSRLYCFVMELQVREGEQCVWSCLILKRVKTYRQSKHHDHIEGCRELMLCFNSRMSNHLNGKVTLIVECHRPVLISLLDDHLWFAFHTIWQIYKINLAWLLVLNKHG